MRIGDFNPGADIAAAPATAGVRMLAPRDAASFVTDAAGAPLAPAPIRLALALWKEHAAVILGSGALLAYGFATGTTWAKWAGAAGAAYVALPAVEFVIGGGGGGGG